MRRAVPFAVLALLAATAASAQLPPRYYWETAQPCAAGVCTRPAPTAAEFSRPVNLAPAPIGMSLASVRGYAVTVCAADGFTLSGGGSLAVYVWEPWQPGKVLRNLSLDLPLSSVTSATACSGGPCQCATFPDSVTGIRLGRRVLFAASGVTVSGGASISVYINADTSSP